MKTVLVIALAATTILVAFLVYSNKNQAPDDSVSLESNNALYLPLGDSYTIGEGVPVADRWPNQLTARLADDGVMLKIADNPSVTGYTTQDLIDNELSLVKTLRPGFVSLLIGVNDYVQGVSEQTFQENYRIILDEIEANLDSNKIIIVTIPDFSKTPSGSGFGDAEQASLTIKRFNEFIIKEATSRNLLVVDIYEISQRASGDNSLVASDGLHPSGKQYALWVDAIYAEIKKNDLFK